MVIHYGRYSHKLVNKITKGYSKPKDIKKLWEIRRMDQERLEWLMYVKK